LSFLFIFWVLKVNSFAAANISVADDHKVIDTGPQRAATTRLRGADVRGAQNWRRSRQGRAQSAHGFPQMTTANPSGIIPQ